MWQSAHLARILHVLKGRCPWYSASGGLHGVAVETQNSGGAGLVQHGDGDPQRAAILRRPRAAEARTRASQHFPSMVGSVLRIG